MGCGVAGKQVGTVALIGIGTCLPNQHAGCAQKEPGKPPYNAEFPHYSASMSVSPVSELLDLLTLERLEKRLFRGQSRDIGSPNVFGGQVLSQALSAAQATLDTLDTARMAHSLHAYFLRAGDIRHPIVYEVDMTRDGGAFSVRRVTAVQHGQVIFFASVSFQREETGVEHQLPMPEVPPPEALVSTPAIPLPEPLLAELPSKVRRWLDRTGPFEFRPVEPFDELNPPKHPPSQQLWFRLSERVGDAPELHRALLAYASDFRLLGTANLPHGIGYHQPGVQMASLDHALWFHRPFRADEWLLYAMDSPSAQGNRGLSRGIIYDRQGRLVASAAQEGMVRVRTPG